MSTAAIIVAVTAPTTAATTLRPVTAASRSHQRGARYSCTGSRSMRMAGIWRRRLTGTHARVRAGRLFDTRISTTSAAPAVRPARKVMSDVNTSEAITQPDTLSGPGAPVWAAPRFPNPRHRRWAVPLALLALGAALVFLAASVVLVDRYAEAPGTASAVEDRLSFDAVPRFDPNGEILFVTVAGPHLTGLQAAIGWLDPDVDQFTYEERFGTITPDEDRSRNLEAMRDAKDDAPYVALTKLGYPTELIPGSVIVNQVLCLEASADGRTCADPVPADVFLDPGDQIISVEGTPIVTREDLTEALADFGPGDVAEFTVRREAPTTGETGDAGVEQTGDVELIANPDDPSRSFIGIELADTAQVNLPFEIDIETGSIGGPSAGLAFTLTLLDALTPGELTGGKRVAVTGTIDIRGNVGPIGGIRQKSVAVKQQGADLFIVPAGQSPEDLDAVRRTLGADRVAVVANLDEALAALAAVGGNALELGTPGTSYTG